ncbi:MAG: recombinase family protein [Asticcacaulis sp.]
MSRVSHSRAGVNALPQPTKAVIYARVSSKEQEREGFSIPAQLKLLNEHAEAHELKVAKEFVDVETAKSDGRTHFNAMVTYLRKHPSIRTVLVEKTDRLYRNLKDWVTIDELDIEIDLVKEGVSLSRDSRSSEKFMHGIKVLMAKNYIDNLSEEVRKGMLEKAEQGLWPSAAPFGYKNNVTVDGKRIIEIDPLNAHIIPQIFQWYASGSYSIREIGNLARRAGLKYPKSAHPVPNSTIHRILRNRLYAGEFEWLGTVYVGRHEPLISKDLWLIAQDVLDGRHTTKVPTSVGSTKDFAFTGLITCGHCGCTLTPEIKKQKYIYYHCTAYRGKCPEKYVREEKLTEQFAGLLKQLRFDDEIYDLTVRALKSSFATERLDHEQAITRLNGEASRLRLRIEAAYVDKLDGKVSADYYKRAMAQWQEELRRCHDDLKRYEQASEAYMDEGVNLLILAREAHTIFETQTGIARKKLLNFVLSNCKWAHGELIADFRQPFELLKERLAPQNRPEKGDGYDDAGKENWLGN